ncbi:MAG: response regulator [Cyclobacteriaceae bacterium]
MYSRHLSFLLYLIILPLSASPQIKEVDSVQYFLGKIETESDSLILGGHYFDAGYHLIDRFEYDSAESYLISAIDYLGKKDKLLTGKVYYNLSSIYSDRDEISKAIDSQFKALHCFEQINNKEWIANALNVLGNSYNYLGEYEKSFGFYSRAENLFESINDQVGLASLYHNYAIIYGEQNDLKKELEYYQKATDLFKLYGENGDLTMSYANIALNLMEAKDYDGALRYNDLAFQEAEKNNQQFLIPYITNNAGSIYFEMGEYETTIEYATRGYDMAMQQEDAQVMTAAMWNLTLSHEKLGNYKEAYDLAMKNWELDSILYNEKNAKIIHELETEYRVDEVEKENEILKQRDEIQQAEIKQQRLIGGFFISGILILSLFIIILWIGNNKIRSQWNQIQKQADKLKQIDAHKSRFFANISHDLRTPITLIVGYIHQLKADVNSKLSERAARSLERLESNSEKLKSMTDEIKDLILLEEGNLTLHYEKVKVKSFLGTLVNMFSSSAEIGETKLVYKSDCEDDLIIHFDKVKIEQVIYNLISNAFKYTTRGEIGVYLTCAKDKVLIGVKDSGRGIHKEHIPFVFDRFYQSPDNEYKSREGLGIGLSLVKELIELHGGSIKVESTLGYGTHFMITLPFNLDKEADHVENGLSKHDGPLNVKGAFIENPDLPRIMIVDDHNEIRQYISEVLTGHYNVIEASNGQDALEKLAKKPVDLIMTDLMMPWLDGFELIEKLEQDESLSDIPVMVVSARNTEKDKNRVLDIGVNDFVSKPFDPTELVKRINNLIQRSDSSNTRDLWKNVIADRDLVSNVKSDILKKVNAHIIERISDPTLTVNDIAVLICASERKTYRLFKDLTGQTPLEYIKSIRFDFARELVESGKAKSLHEAAKAIGMNNSTLFAQQYEKKYGVKPLIPA